MAAPHRGGSYWGGGYNPYQPINPRSNLGGFGGYAAQLYGSGPSPYSLHTQGAAGAEETNMDSSSSVVPKLQKAMGAQQQAMSKIEAQVGQLEETLEATRKAYNAALEERNEMHNLLESAEGRLGEVQKVVQRYINVQEPVVASDGYTYERSVIQQYLEECQQSNNKAYSQLTKEVLSETLLPNQSLKKLVELLKTVEPQEVEELRAHEPLAPVREGGRGVDLSTIKFFDDDVQEDGGSRRPDELSAPVMRQPERDGSPPQAQQQQRSQAPPQDDLRVKLHPCLRVYGFCNFKDDCCFALYPYDACLNFIKGKCRFGSKCKELHVDPSDSRYHNGRPRKQGA